MSELASSPSNTAAQRRAGRAPARTSRERACELTIQHSSAANAPAERRRGRRVSELASSPSNTAAQRTRRPSASEDVRERQRSRAAARTDGESHPDPALAAAAEAAALLGADIAGVLLTDDAGATATMHTCAGRWTVHSLNLRVRPGTGWPGGSCRRADRGRSTTTPATARSRPTTFALILADDGTRAGLGAPMLAGDELVGVLMAWSRRPGAFDVTATQAMVTLADLAALAVAGSRRAQAAEREVARLAGRCDELAECVAARGRSAAFRDELAELLITGCETAALLSAVCVHTGGDAALFDQGLGELAACGAAGPDPGTDRGTARRRARPRHGPAAVDVGARRRRRRGAPGPARSVPAAPAHGRRPRQRTATPPRPAHCTSPANGLSWTPAPACTPTSCGSCWKGSSTRPSRWYGRASSGASCRRGCGSPS